MRQSVLPQPTAAPAFVGAVSGIFQAVLLASLVLVPTVFGGLHRYGSFDLLLVVGLVLAFWAVSSLWGVPLRHVRSHVNLFIWLVLGLLFLHIVPLPRLGPVGQSIRSLGLPTDVLVNGGFEGVSAALARLPVARYSLRPASSLGVLVLAASAVGLYWVVGSAVVGRKAILRTMWAALLGAALLALWVIVSCVRGRGAPAADVFRPVPGVPIRGGDSLVPALLGALPVAYVLVLRPLGWLPHQPPARRQSRWAWLGRPAVVWSLVATALLAMVAIGLGASNVPRGLAVVTALAPLGFVLAGYGLSDGPRRAGRARAVALALALAVCVAAGVGVGAALRGEGLPATGTEAALDALRAALPQGRALLGVGAGSVSPSALFGAPAWSGMAAADGDTSGYRVLGVEIGSVGLLAVLAGGIAMAVSKARAIRRARSPWTRLAPWAALGAMAANALYFAFDASAVLAPNLLLLAAVLGIATAWHGHGILWRPERLGDLAPTHWAFVGGALGLLASLAVAESEMVAGIGPEFQDKVLHFGAFGILSALFCYALGPEPSARYLKTRILLSVSVAIGLGVLVEFAQACLAATRAFEVTDMIANAGGAALMGLVWWVFRRGQLSLPAAAPSDA